MWPWYPMSWLFRHAPVLSAEHHDKLDFCFLLLLPGGRHPRDQTTASFLNFYIWTAALFFSCWGMYGSIPRFDLVMFPLFLVLALIGIHSRAFHLGYCILSSMLAALFMMMHSQWNWVA